MLIPLCVVSIALAIASVWGRMTVQRNWRGWLTGKVIDYWVDNDRYAHLAAVQSEQQIPEYRITEDVRIATDAPIDFALGLVSSLLTAMILIQVLWTVGGDLSSHWVYRVWVPGYLVISVALYSGVVTIAMISGASGKPAPGSIANQPGHRDHRWRGALDQPRKCARVLG